MKDICTQRLLSISQRISVVPLINGVFFDTNGPFSAFRPLGLFSFFFFFIGKFFEEHDHLVKSGDVIPHPREEYESFMHNSEKLNSLTQPGLLQKSE